MALIYAFTNPEIPGEYRYVGKTVNTLRKRLEGHRRSLLTSSAWVYRWIRTLDAFPPVVVLEETTDDIVCERERVWIAALRAAGHRLTNLTDGGDGLSGYRHPPEVIARVTAKLRGQKRSPETCARIGDVHRGRKRPPETGEKIRAAKLVKRGNHCRHGHEFTPENTRIRPKDAARICRTCERDASRKFEAKRVRQPRPQTDEIRAYQRAWRAKHRDKQRARCLEYYYRKKAERAAATEG